MRLSRAIPLLVLLVATTARAATPLGRRPLAGHTRRMLDRVHRQAPSRSLLNLGIRHYRLGDLSRAAEVLTFALMQDPDNLRLLWALARTHARLGNYGAAKVYVGHLLILRPGAATARTLDRRLDTAIKKRSAELASSAKTKGTTGTKTAAKTKPVVKAKTPTKTKPLAKAGGKSKAAKAVERKKLVLSCQLEDKLRILRLVKAIDSAVIQYNLAHPKKKMAKLDLAILRKEKILPARLDLSAHEKKLAIKGGLCHYEGFGDRAKLGKEVDAYRNGLVEIAKYTKQKEYFEAFLAARRLAAKYPGETRACERRVYATLLLNRPDRASREVDGLVTKYPDDPGLLYRSAQLHYRLGHNGQVRSICRRLREAAPKSMYARLGDELLRAVNGGIPFETLRQTLLLKAKHFATPKKEPKKDNKPAKSTKPAQKNK